MLNTELSEVAVTTTVRPSCFVSVMVTVTVDATAVSPSGTATATGVANTTSPTEGKIERRKER